MGRCLLIECLPKHTELLPSWLVPLGRLGHEVECVCDGGLPEPAPGAFDFVVLNTLVDEAYHVPPGRVRPDLDLLARLGRPSIAAVHEPMDWLEKRVTAAFDEQRPRGGTGTVFLLADGTALRGDGSWALSWSRADGTLRLPVDGGLVRLESRDGGASYRSAGGGHRLRARPPAAHDLGRHLAGGRHAVVAWSRQGCDYLCRGFPGVEWLLPLEFGEAAPPELAFAVPGAIDYARKDFPALLDACARTPLSPAEAVWIVGGGRSPEQFEDGRCPQRLREEVRGRGLEAKIKLTGYLPEDEYFGRVRSSRFLLPLVDDSVDGGAYRTKLPSAVALGVALGIPLVLEERLADRFDLGFMVRYRAGDLASGLEAARTLPEEAYRRLRAETLRRRERLRARNAEVLTRLIAGIMAPG